MPNCMENTDLDSLQQVYKQAVDHWIAAIQAEESLATANHSENAMEKWDRASFAVDDAEKQAKEARANYKEGLRKLHYGI